MIALALLAAPAQAAPASSYPSAQVLAAFGGICRNVKDLERTENEAEALGWTRITPDPATPIGQLVAFGMSEGKKMVEAQRGSITPMRVLSKDVAGEALVAVLSGVRVGGEMVNGCRVYDGGETRRITAAEAEAWVGRAPTRTEANRALSIASWEPGFAPDHASFELYHIPADSPALALVKVSGVALKADYVGADK